MRHFDAAATAEFFNGVYAAGNVAAPTLHSRDKLLLANFLSHRPAPLTKVLDFGCGQGRLLQHMLSLGYDAIGIEKHEGMREHAERIAPDRVHAGGVEALDRFDSGSFDVVALMGILQYVSDEDFRRLLTSSRRLLRPGGVIAATFQNALFDLYTFNKYTVDCYEHLLVGPHVDSDERAAVSDAIKGLIVQPEAPMHARGRARDNIFVRLTNPLTIADELAPLGLRVQRKFFYEFFGLPPLLCGAHPQLAAKIKARFEGVNATAWQGTFMANAFLAEIYSSDQNARGEASRSAVDFTSTSGFHL